MAGLINSFWGSGVVPTLTVTSTDAAWSPLQVAVSSGTQTWEATGAVTDTQVANDPTFDLSSSGGGTTNFALSDPTKVTTFRIITATRKVTSFDTQVFTALTLLNLVSQLLTTLDLTPTFLGTVLVNNNTSLTSLDTTGNTGLGDLQCFNCGLTGTLDLSTNTSLNTVRCYTNSLTGVTLNSNVTLAYINSNPIVTYSTSGYTALTQLHIYSCSLTSLTLTGGALVTLRCDINAGLASLDLGSEPNITTLFCGSCNLTNGITNLTTPTGMIDLRTNGNSFTSTATNQMLADLVANGQSGGRLDYRNNETGAGVTDRATLITRGWAITNFAT